MKHVVLLLVFLPTFSNAAAKELIKIAVIDSGFTQTKAGGAVPLCAGEHADISGIAVEKDGKATVDAGGGVITKKFDLNLTKPPADSETHGTNIVYVINNQLKRLGGKGYCFAIIKYWHPIMDRDENQPYSARASKASLAYVAYKQFSVLNYSAGGPGFSQIEQELVKTILNNGTLFVAAAGNNGEKIHLGKRDTGAYYPASYDNRIVVVGSVNRAYKKLPSSNYGDIVDAQEIGEEVDGGGIVLTGTSQATAVHTGKQVFKIIRSMGNP